VVAGPGDGRGRHILILVQNLPVPFDRRVWQEATALRDLGYQVHVVSPRATEYRQRRELLQGIRIYRYRPGPEARRSLAYLLEYVIAIAAHLRLALAIRLRHRIAAVHVCNPPDLLFVAALPLMLLGSRLIYDHHDACPELMMAKGLPARSWQVRLTRTLERLTYRLCDVSIETNESYRAIALTRGRMRPENVFVVRSAPADSRFARAVPDDRWRYGRRYLVAYVGVMGRQDGLDYLLDAARAMVHNWRRADVQFVLVGGGPELARLRARVQLLDLSEHVIFCGRLPDHELGEILATADVCVNPDEVNPMNDISTMNKIMEYMALGKPIVQFDVREGRVSAGAASLYARPNDPVSLAACIAGLLDNATARERMGTFGRLRLEGSLSWERQVPQLRAAYDHATRGRRPGSAPSHRAVGTSQVTARSPAHRQGR